MFSVTLWDYNLLVWKAIYVHHIFFILLCSENIAWTVVPWIKVLVVANIIKEFVCITAIMEIGSAGTAGHITIQGKESKLYIAMDRKGRLYGEVSWKT